MKKYTLILAILLAAFIISCEDNFNPLGEYSERYVLNCVVKPDTNLQIATVSQSYLNNSIDPYDNTTDPFIENVYLRLWYDDEVYIFKDSILTRENTDRYETPVKIYYLDNLDPKPGSELEIEALLPNGRRLNSKTLIPVKPKKVAASSSRIIPPEETDDIRIQWESDIQGLTYHPKLYVVYNKTENGSRVRKTESVPVEYYNDGGILRPIYPAASASRNLSIDMDDFNRFMESISEGVENKRDFEFMFMIVEVLAFDRNLSLYYASSNTVLDEYSIKLDEADFTNIDGGFGVFGSFVKGLFTIKFTTEYLETLGYRNGFD